MSDAESLRRERILRSLTFLAALTAAALTAYLGWRISHPSTVAEVDIDVEFEEALLLGETREVRRILESGFRPEDSRYNDVPVAIRAIVSRHHQMLPLLGRERLNERDATGTPHCCTPRLSDWMKR